MISHYTQAESTQPAFRANQRFEAIISESIARGNGRARLAPDGAHEGSGSHGEPRTGNGASGRCSRVTEPIKEAAAHGERRREWARWLACDCSCTGSAGPRGTAHGEWARSARVRLRPRGKRCPRGTARGMGVRLLLARE